MMENQMFDIPLEVASRNYQLADGISPYTNTNTLEHLSDHHSDIHVTNGANLFSSNAFCSYSRSNVITNASLGSYSASSNSEFQGSPNSGSVATLLAARDGLQENLNSLAISVPPIYASEVIPDYVSTDCSNSSNPRPASSSMNLGYDEMLRVISSQWDMQKFPSPSEFSGKISELHSYSSIGNLDPNEWISSNSSRVGTVHSYGSSKFSNVLSLTLATSQPSAISGINIPGQTSEITYSGVAHNPLNEARVGSEQTSSSTEELSLTFGSYRGPNLSQIILGSRYLSSVQEILAQMASFSLENVDHTSYLTATLAGQNTPFSWNCPAEGGSLPALQGRAFEAKKAKLLALLQMVDDRYSQCLDEIHTVVSAFHAATELDPQIHARFALQTISCLYKNLRERISNLCLAIEADSNPVRAEENGKSFETSFIQKQWALQQLKRKDHQLWRPQRGLPERSVSVLRAWMFQNFLHPYPKDAEKHLLAVKSGLTRNQVSNWFINARVRLWKPMIEEMYAEMNRRKSRRNENTERVNQRSLISTNINSQRYNAN
ncbi:hypothetical protein UlMin_034978 [Ulmus minor]